MKQSIFKDPYAQVRFRELFSQAIWKGVVFYLALLSLASLCLTGSGKKVFTVLGIALAAALVLALAFEAGSAICLSIHFCSWRWRSAWLCRRRPARRESLCFF